MRAKGDEMSEVVDEVRELLDACVTRIRSEVRDLDHLIMRERATNPQPVYPTHDKNPNLRPHTIAGWWQVWSGGLCIALLTPEDVAPLIARTTCYVADTEESPHKVTFANGRTVHVDSDGCLQVGHGEYPEGKA